jgi:GNAT superfamily N-acetyltransferase
LAIPDSPAEGIVSDTKVAIEFREMAPVRGRLDGLLELLRVEGPVMFARHALQRYASRLLTHLDVFEFDLARAASLDTSTYALPPGVTSRIFRGEAEIEPLFAILEQSRLSRATVEQRMARGDLVMVATAGDDLVGYSWTTFTEAWISEIGATLVPRKGELVQYDKQVMPRWRGKGLQYAMSVAILSHLSKLGYKRTLGWVDALNTRSLKNQYRLGKRKVADVISVPALGIVRVRNYSAVDGVTIEKRALR